MKRALIVGMSGQDGAYLARFLLEKDYEVIGTSRGWEPSKLGNLHALQIAEQVRCESMNPSDLRSVVKVLGKWMPQEIYNLSSQSSVAVSFKHPAATFKSIADSTVTLLEAIRLHDAQVRFFNAGSSECFGDVSCGLANEETPFRPQSPYAAAKAAAYWMVVAYCRSFGLFACNGILFNHESPLRPERYVTKKIVAAVARIVRGSPEKLRLGNLQVRRDWGWAPEYVDAMWRTLQQETPRDYVIATGRLAGLDEFVASAFDAAGLDWRVHVETDPGLRRSTDIEGFAGDASRAEKDLGWRATTTMPDVARTMLRLEIEGRDIVR